MPNTSAGVANRRELRAAISQAAKRGVSIGFDDRNNAQIARVFFEATTKRSSDPEDILPQEGGNKASEDLSVFRVFSLQFPEVVGCGDSGVGACKLMRMHFNKIGFSIYGKEQSRRVPSQTDSTGSRSGYGFRRARGRDVLNDADDSLCCEALLRTLQCDETRIRHIKAVVDEFRRTWEEVRRSVRASRKQPRSSWWNAPRNALRPMAAHTSPASATRLSSLSSEAVDTDTTNSQCRPPSVAVKASQRDPHLQTTAPSPPCQTPARISDVRRGTRGDSQSGSLDVLAAAGLSYGRHRAFLSQSQSPKPGPLSSSCRDTLPESPVDVCTSDGTRHSISISEPERSSKRGKANASEKPGAEEWQEAAAHESLAKRKHPEPLSSAADAWLQVVAGGRESHGQCIQVEKGGAMHVRNFTDVLARPLPLSQIQLTHAPVHCGKLAAVHQVLALHSLSRQTYTQNDRDDQQEFVQAKRLRVQDLCNGEASDHSTFSFADVYLAVLP